jgi:hypothetical protein
MKAAVVALKEFDGKQPCMGNVYMIMRALCHHVAALHNAPFNMPSDLVEPFEVALKNREALVASDLHYAGALPIHTSLKIWNFVMTRMQWQDLWGYSKDSPTPPRSSKP